MHCALHNNSRPNAHSARMRHWPFLSLKKPGFFCLLLALSLTLRAAEGDAPAPPPVITAPVTAAPVAAAPVAVTAQSEAAVGSNDIVRAYFELQDQVLATQIAVERARQEFQAATVQDASAISNRLQAIQESLVLQHTELAEAHHLNRLLLVVMGVFAVLIFAGAGFTVYFQSRAMHRLADISAELSAARGMALALPSAASLELRDHKALSNGAVDQSSARLSSLVQILEKRVGELEQTAGVPIEQKAEPITNGHTQKHIELTLSDSKDSITPKDLETPKDVVTASADLPVTTDLAAPKDVAVSEDLDASKDVDVKEVSTAPKDVTIPKKMTASQEVTANWMERAQSFMAADRFEDAMAFFDAILATAPNNAEALLKKGMALEKMNRSQEALEYYDRAVAADNKLTIAHLQKGALCDKLEKYGEAIGSYEQALHTREKEQVA
jgi:tetratricopeptide (TPR) repeat protein